MYQYLLMFEYLDWSVQCHIFFLLCYQHFNLPLFRTSLISLIPSWYSLNLQKSRLKIWLIFPYQMSWKFLPKISTIFQSPIPQSYILSTQTNIFHRHRQLILIMHLSHRLHQNYCPLATILTKIQKFKNFGKPRMNGLKIRRKIAEAFCTIRHLVTKIMKIY